MKRSQGPATESGEPAPEIRLRDVTARGVRTRVLEAGDPAAPALVLIHGLFASHLTFEEVTADLARRFHVIAPDLPGFGESEKPTPSRYAYGIEIFAEAIADLIAAFGVGRASVAGHGMGGAVALTLAAVHTELVQRLVLIDALSYPTPTTFRSRLPLMPVLGGLVFKQLWGRSLFRATFREEVFPPGVPLPLARIDHDYDLFNTPSARESAHAVMRAMLDTRALVARLSRIDVPTLIVWGREDRRYPVAAAQRLAREIRAAKLEIMETGHAPQEERPKEFSLLITQFLEGRR